jgi:hypothetical protein
MVYLFPDLPSTYVPGEKQELSKQEKMGNQGTVESCVWSLVLPLIARGTATGCGTQKPRRFPRHMMWYFLMRCKAPENTKNVRKKQDPEDTEP